MKSWASHGELSKKEQGNGNSCRQWCTCNIVDEKAYAIVNLFFQFCLPNAFKSVAYLECCIQEKLEKMGINLLR